MLKKILNPFGIKVTQASKAYVWVGMLSTLILHVLFYYVIYHFIAKHW